jgi:hypothetical protein
MASASIPPDGVVFTGTSGRIVGQPYKGVRRAVQPSHSPYGA